VTPLFGAMYDEPGDVVACEDHAANPFVLPGDSGAVGVLVPMLFVRLHVCTTDDDMSTELYLRTATGEVYVA
jgi:hypothetical protein